MKKRIRRNARMQPRSMFETVIDLFGQLDADRDGVPDRRDCRPMDPTKHGIQPSRAMRQRLEDLPLFVASGMEIMHGPPSHPRHIMQKSAKKVHPEATRSALSTIKKYPGIIGQMEKMPKAKYTFVMKPSSEFGFGATSISGTAAAPYRSVYIFQPPERLDRKEDYITEAMQFIEDNYPRHKQDFHKQRMLDQAERIIFSDDSEIEKRRKIQHSFAVTSFHELKHVEQSGEIEEFQKTIDFEQVIPYLSRKTEIDAIEASRKEMKKRLEKGELSPEVYRSILGLE